MITYSPSRRLLQCKHANAIRGEGPSPPASETIHLLGSPANASRLLLALAQAEAGKLAEHELIED